MLGELLAATVLYWPSVIAIALVTQLFRARYLDGLSGFPGPRPASFTDGWRVWNTWYNNTEKPYMRLHEKYGDVVRTGPKVLSFSSPEAIRDIYGTQQNYKKSDYYVVSQSTARGESQQTVFASIDQKWHFNIRKAVSHAFTLTSILQYEPYVDATISLFLTSLEKKAEDGRIDLTKRFEYFAWDVVSEMTYGERPGFIESGMDSFQILDAVRVKMDYIRLVGQMPWLDKILMKNPILLWLDRHGYTNISSNLLVQFAMKHQLSHESRRKGGSNQSLPCQKDLFDKFLDARDAAPGVITDREIMSLGLTMIFTGAETTAITLVAIFYDLMKHPRVYGTLQKEIENLPSPIPYTSAQRLPYLDACIKESIRLYPAVAILPERIVSEAGATICGHFVPGGTLVGATPWVLNRNKAVFGEDADLYRPERWLGGEEFVTEMNRVMFTFGGGPHVCLGKNVALLEIYKIVPEMLKRFEIKLEEPDYELRTVISNLVMPSELYVDMKLR